MITRHNIVFGNSNNLSAISSKSVDLVVTSPPYPMIGMWDSVFSGLNPDIDRMLSENRGPAAFELMHKELDKTWKEMHRVLKDGGMACINIGDAVRTIGGNFQLYSNHSRILAYCVELGFGNLPCILWRKQTNAPNKFMGSGMLPPGAYVTLEHEFILILRKGRKREFAAASEKANRARSAFFWEERNNWFSDVWFDVKGANQKLAGEETRVRNAAFPFELAYRLINMFSIYGDLVVDPFLGTGTTMLAAMASGRNSVGIEIDPNFIAIINKAVDNVVDFSNKYVSMRLERHIEFVGQRIKDRKDLLYINKRYGFPIMTRQEVDIEFFQLSSINRAGPACVTVSYNSPIQTEGDAVAVNKSESCDRKHAKRCKKEPVCEKDVFV